MLKPGEKGQKATREEHERNGSNTPGDNSEQTRDYRKHDVGELSPPVRRYKGGTTGEITGL